MQMEVVTPKSVILSSDDAGFSIPMVQENVTVTLKDIASASGFPNVSFNIGCNITVSKCCTKENVMESFVFTAFMKENLVLFLILFCVLMLVIMRCVTCCMSKSRVKKERKFTLPKVCNFSFPTLLKVTLNLRCVKHSFLEKCVKYHVKSIALKTSFKTQTVKALTIAVTLHSCS